VRARCKRVAAGQAAAAEAGRGHRVRGKNAELYEKWWELHCKDVERVGAGAVGAGAVGAVAVAVGAGAGAGEYTVEGAGAGAGTGGAGELPPGGLLSPDNYARRARGGMLRDAERELARCVAACACGGAPGAGVRGWGADACAGRRTASGGAAEEHREEGSPQRSAAREVVMLGALM
jgi:hypothetical protein